MSTMEEQLATVPKTTALEIVPRPAKKAKIEEVDAIPHREVEVVSKEEEKHQRQLEKKAKKPATCFTSSAAVSDRQIIGAEVDSEALFGFLSAAERVVPADKSQPILSSIKLSYEQGAERMFIEAASTNIWTAIALKAQPRGDRGFEVMVPARHARNAVNTMRDSFRTVSVGVNDGGFWIGQHCIPSGGRVSDFPPRPLLRQWEARAVVPAFYFEEICSRVLTVSSKDPTKPGLHGVLLDFAVARDRTVTCTAVGSDGVRMHILELPQMKIQTRGNASPPGLMIGEQFFRYLRAVANREWTALELSETQACARGEDYQAVTVAVMKGATSTRGLESWRSVNVDHPGYWAVDRKELERIMKKAKDEGSDEKVDIRFDAMHEQLDLWFYNQESRKVKETIGARRFGGPAAVDVPVNVNFLLAASAACKSGLIRLGFAATKEQGRSPVTIRGEDDQFKAIVMPIG
jgi:DNA polymerase III sliding clamp (beta) subunit (PCNA family)